MEIHYASDMLIEENPKAYPFLVIKGRRQEIRNTKMGFSLLIGPFMGILGHFSARKWLGKIHFLRAKSTRENAHVPFLCCIIFLP